MKGGFSVILLHSVKVARRNFFKYTNVLSFSLVFIKLREVINNNKKKRKVLKFFRPPLKFRPKNKLVLKCHTRIGVG